jgi:hypothetical protein
VGDQVPQAGASTHRTGDDPRQLAVPLEDLEMFTGGGRQLVATIRDEMGGEVERVLKREEHVERDDLLRRAVREEPLALGASRATAVAPSAMARVRIAAPMVRS